MKKFLIFFILAIIGCGLFLLSAINESLVCSHSTNSCSLKSKIHLINYTISELSFEPSDIRNVYCETAYQPDAGGKKPYYLLKLILNDKSEYTIGSFQKQGLCKYNSDKISDFKQKKSEYLDFSPAFGFVNLMGAVFGIIMFTIGIMILRASSVPDYDGLDDEDEEEDDNEISEKEKANA